MGFVEKIVKGIFGGDDEPQVIQQTPAQASAPTAEGASKENPEVNGQKKKRRGKKNLIVPTATNKRSAESGAGLNI